jgi:hypothetical protein
LLARDVHLLTELLLTQLTQGLRCIEACGLLCVELLLRTLERGLQALGLNLTLLGCKRTGGFCVLNRLT